MAWIMDKKPNVYLKLSPSLGFNNLTSNMSSMAYVHKGSVVICGLDGELKRTLNNEGGVRAFEVLLCSGEDFDFLVIALNTGVQVWSTDGRRMIYSFDANGPGASPPPSSPTDTGSQFTQGIAMVPKGKMFFVGCSDGDVFAFEAKCGLKGESCELTSTLRGHSHPVTCAGADPAFCASGDGSGSIVVWNIAKHLARECSFDGDGNPATSLCVRGNSVVAAFSTGHLRIFDICKSALSAVIAAHSRIINAIALHPTSMLLATVGEDLFLNVWELPERGQDGPSSQVGLLASSRVADYLLSGVQFLVDGSHRIVSTAYDSHNLRTWHKL